MEARIKRLKAKGRKLYTALSRERGNLPCGRNLALAVNPRISEIEQQLEAVLNNLREIDPEFPQTINN